MKQVHFHSDFATMIVYVNGVPTAVHGEVDVVIKQPSKLTAKDNAAWETISKRTAAAITVESIPGVA